jgi:hypothetical protein
MTNVQCRETSDQRLKNVRALATRYDKRAYISLATVITLAALTVWSRT